MNALLQPAALQLRPMQLADLAQVVHVESRCYAFPWTHGNFVDSLAAGYAARVLVDARGGLVGYFVAMAGVGEMHLLNITVSPEHQRCGHALRLLDAIEQLCRELRLPQLWLEVRQGNARALSIYRRRGFVAVGLRRDYYPALQGRREDAVVMRAAIAGVPSADGVD